MSSFSSDFQTLIKHFKFPLYFLYELLMDVKSLFLNSVHNIVGFLLKTLEKSLFRFQDKQPGRPAVLALGNRP